MNIVINGWAALKGMAIFAMSAFYCCLFALFLYQFCISVFGWFKRKEDGDDKYPPSNRFALIVAAYNEEVVVGNIVRNLKNLDYPKKLYDVFVVADNCSDNTAKVARDNGAYVYERFDGKLKGKGHALNWMFKQLSGLKENYDAVCIFDADNLASPNFLKVMNRHLCKGHKVIQAYLDSKNPFDTWISGSYSIAYWISNRLFQLPRHCLGLCCALGGTGFAMSADIVKEIGWNATCLTEDLEFSIQLVLKGMKVYWAHDASVYDEKPLTLAQSWKQRKRWMQGQADCACRYIGRLFRKTVKDKDIVALDCAVYLLQPLLLAASGLLTFAQIIIEILLAKGNGGLFNAGSIPALLLTLMLSYGSGVFVGIEGRFSFKILKGFFLLPLFGLSWIPIIIQGYIDKNEKEWAHTMHTRAVDMADIISSEE